MTSEIDNCPKILDLTHMIALVFLLVSWTLTHKSWGFFSPYHGHNLIQILEINQIVGFVAITCIQYFWFTLMGFSPPRL